MAKHRSVAFVLPNGFDLGGVTTWSLRMSGWLRKRDYAVTLLSHDSVVPGGIGAPPEGVALRRVPARAFWPHDRYVRRFVGAYAETLPAVVVPNYSLGAYAATAVLAQTRADEIRVVGFAHTDVDEYYRQLEYYEPMIHAFVAVSDTIGEELRRRLPHRAAHVFVRPYAVPRPVREGRAHTPAGRPIRLAYGGRIELEQKRVLDLAALAAQLHERGVPFRLDIAGTGHAEDLLRARVAALPPVAAASVTFHGQIPNCQMGAFWDRADVCVLTSAFEGTSISMLEAMGHGCVPVVTAVSGTDAVVRPGENGFVAPVGDIDGLSEAVARLAADRALLAAMGQEAAEDVAAISDPGPYVHWATSMLDRAWSARPRPWPPGRPISPPWYPYRGLPLPLVRFAQAVSLRLARYPRVFGPLRSAFRAATGRFR